MHRRMLSSALVNPIQSNFFSSLSITYYSDLFPKITRIDSCFFSEFPQSSIFERFSSLDASLGEHDAAVSMDDTQYLSLPLPFSEADSSCALVEPNPGSNPFFPRSSPFFIRIHRGNYMSFWENRKKFA